VTRDPRDVVVSFYRFLREYFETPELNFHDFVETFFFGNGSKHGGFWAHLLSWYARIYDENVLFLFFEDMKEDLEACVRRVQVFIGAPAKNVSVAVERSSFAYMKKNSKQFDDNWVRGKLSKQMGLSGDRVAVGKVNQGKVGGHGEMLEPWMEERLEQEWRRSMGRFGFASYAALRKEFGLRGSRCLDAVEV
jgi:hypothetical protein